MEFIVERGTPIEDEVQVWTTVLLPGLPPMHVGWSVALFSGTAKIVDVIEEGASVRITQRNGCASFLAQNYFDIEALIKMLRRQAAVTS
jgi:phospholipid transport system substrate-binding protein